MIAILYKRIKVDFASIFQKYPLPEDWPYQVMCGLFNI